MINISPFLHCTASRCDNNRCDVKLDRCKEQTTHLFSTVLLQGVHETTGVGQPQSDALQIITVLLKHTHRHTDIHTHTHTHTDIHTHRHTDIHTHRHTDIYTHRDTQIYTHTETHRYTDTDTHPKILNNLMY